MNTTFDETKFVVTITRLGAIIPEISARNDAEEFLQIVRVHCGFSIEDLCLYVKGVVESQHPDIYERFSVEDWRGIYDLCIADHNNLKDKKIAITKILRQGRGVLDKSETLERFFILSTQRMKINSDVYIGLYLFKNIRINHLLNLLDKQGHLIELGNSDDEVSTTKVIQTEGVESQCEPNVAVEGINEVDKMEGAVENDSETSESIVNKSTMSSVEESEQVTADEAEKTIVEKDSTLDVVVEKKMPTETKGKRRYREPIVRFTLEGVLVEEEPFESALDAERKTDIKHSNISTCLNGKTKSAGGYIWKYFSDVNVDESSKCVISPSSTGTTQLHKKKLDRTDKMILVAYRFNGKELDETSPIGKFKNQQEVNDYFGISICSISKHLSQGYNHKRLKWFKNKEKTLYEWIALKLEREAA